MKRFLITLLYCVCILSLNSCSSNPDPGPTPPPGNNDFKMIKGYGHLIENPEVTVLEIKYPSIIQVVLSNTKGGTLENFNGKGEYISLSFVVAEVFGKDEVVRLPEGSYAFSSNTHSNQTIYSGDDTYLVIMDADSKKTRHDLEGTSVSVSLKNEVYTISGELANAAGDKFTFNYEGSIHITRDTPPVIEPYKMTKGYGELKLSDENPRKISLVLSNTNGSTIEDYNGEGEYVSMMLVADMTIGKDDEVVIPADYYIVSTQDNVDRTVLVSEQSYYVMIGNEGSETGLIILSGYIDIKYASGIYTIEGKFNANSDDPFYFTYEGELSINREPPAPPVMVDVTFTNSTVNYFNYYSTLETNPMFNYVATLTNNTGEILSVEILSNIASGYYNRIGDGTYTYSQATPAAGELVDGDNSYYEIEGIRHPIKSGSLKVVPDATYESYTIEGTVNNESGDGINLSFSGALPIDKATLKMTALEMKLYGQYNQNVKSYEYYLMFYNGPYDVWDGLKGLGEAIELNVLSPINRYHYYLPVPNGRYVVEESNEDPFHIATNNDWSDTGVYLLDEDGNGYGSNHYIQSGHIDVESVPDGFGYKYTIKGAFETEVLEEGKNPTEVVGKKMTVEFEYEGTSNGPYWTEDNTTHPMSTLKENATPTFTGAAYEWFWPGAFDLETGVEDATHLTIALKTTNGIYYEWLEDDASKDSWHLLLSINLPVEYDVTQEIPTGIFTLDDTFKCVHFKLMPGFRNGVNSNGFNGSWYLNGDYSRMTPIGYGPDGGEVKITDNMDGTHTIDFHLYEDKRSNQKSITGSYTGEIKDIWDELYPDETSKRETLSSRNQIKRGINGAFAPRKASYLYQPSF